MGSEKFCIFCHRNIVSTGKSKCNKLCKKKTVFFLRGVPSSGKGYMAKLLAGKHGVIIEPDSYFTRTDPITGIITFKFKKKFKKNQRRWTFKRLKEEIKKGTQHIIMDRGNNPSKFAQKLFKYALDHGYHVDLVEPISPWWQEIRVLLRYKEYNKAAIKSWSEFLSKKNQLTHKVSAETIYKRLMRFEPWVNEGDFITYKKNGKSSNTNN